MPLTVRAERFASFCDIPKTDCYKYSLVISKVLLFGRNIDQRLVVGNPRSSTFVSNLNVINIWARNALSVVVDTRSAARKTIGSMGSIDSRSRSLSRLRNRFQ